MRLLASALAALALAACSADDAPPGGYDAGPDAMPRVELGTGTSTFVAIPESGGTLELVMGPQGGYHVDVTVRAWDLDLDRPTLRYEVARVDGASLADISIVDDGRFVRDRDGFVRTGDFAQLDITGPADVVGDEIVVRVTLTTRDGTSVNDERRVTIVDAL